MAPPVWSVGQVLAAADVNSWFIPKVGYKASSTNYTTTSFVADPDLQVSLAASAVYEMRVVLIYSSVSASDVGMVEGFYGPSGASIAWAGFNALFNGSTPPPGASTSILATGDLHTSAGAGTIQGATFNGTVTMGGTAGTFGLQFKENTSGQTVTAVAGSVMTLTRIS